MTRDELIGLLASLAEPDGDLEITHWDADKALIEFIADPEIAAAYERVGKWYA